MTKHAESIRKKQQKASEFEEEWTLRAAQIYQEGQGSSSGPMLSLQGALKKAKRECLDQTGKIVSLNTSRIHRRVQGGKSRQQAADDRNWLTPEETTIVIDFTIEYANRGFPLSHRRLKEHVDQILRARLGDKFPAEGVGKQWTKRFVSDNKRLHMYWSRALDKSRARAVNPNTKAEYFDLLEQVVEGAGGDDRIPPELTWGADESGFQKGIGQRERVIGGAGKKTQHQQRSGDRENITVLVTICADGTTHPPAVIYKGEGFQVKWRQDNPTDASLGYSKKGYIDGEISVEWIKDFDGKTRAKAAGRRRLILLDGHASHYTTLFLQYAKENRIEVVGYPSHSTHVYQGLDVVIFATFKHNWSDARDRWEREGKVVDKTTFLAVYAEAHFKTLTPENIKAAFKKTGVIPLNRDVITEEMMAPSVESSSRGVLPVEQASPVRVMSDMIVDYLDYQRLHTIESSDPDLPATSASATPLPQATPFFARSAVDSLSTTSASFLTSNSPLKSTTMPPAFKPMTISPKRRTSRYADLLGRPAANAREQELVDALAEADERDEMRKAAMIEMQAGIVLAGMYINRAQGQLQAAEEQKQKKNKGRRKMGDGKAKWFTSDGFVQMCIDDDRQKEEEAAGKEGRREEREARAAELAEWKKQNELIRGRNEVKKQQFEADKATWEAEKEEAKVDKRRPAWVKPKWKDYDPETLKPRPKKPPEDEEGETDEDGESANGLDEG